MTIFSPQQDAALKAVDAWLKAKPGRNGTPQVFRLFGYAGTGKTTLAQHIADEVDGEVKFAAFTGKAAAVMRSKGCHNASTIHSLIYRARESGEEVPSFDLYDEAPASKADLIIIDECSMVDAELGRDLISFGVPVLVLGDPAQLPPIQSGANAGGFFTEHEPDVMLTEVHRQAQDNPIIRLSMDIRAGAASSPALRRERRWSPKKSSIRSACSRPIRCWSGGTPRGAPTISGCASGAASRRLPSAGDKLVCLRNNRKKGLFNGALWWVKERGGAQDRHHDDAAAARRRTGRAA